MKKCLSFVITCLHTDELMGWWALDASKYSLSLQEMNFSCNYDIMEYTMESKPFAIEKKKEDEEEEQEHIANWGSMALLSSVSHSHESYYYYYCY